MGEPDPVVLALLLCEAHGPMSYCRSRSMNVAAFVVKLQAVSPFLVHRVRREHCAPRRYSQPEAVYHSAEQMLHVLRRRGAHI